MSEKFDEIFKPSVTRFLRVQLLLDFSLTGVQDHCELEKIVRFNGG